MSKEKDFFDEHVKSLNNFTIFYHYLYDNAKLMDADALLRAEFVLIVSAFDNYLHQIVRRKIRELFFSKSIATNEFNLPISVFQMIYNESGSFEKEQILDVELRRILEKDSFQSPKSVEYALSLINIDRIWKRTAASMQKEAHDVKEQLSLIVKRRNQIAHEADVDYISSFPRNIDEQTICECRDFFIKLVSAIDSLIV